MNTEYFRDLPRTEQNEIRALYEASEKAKQDAIDTESELARPNLTDLKLEINEIVWRNASTKTTLEDAEKMAITFWQAILETHNE